MPTTHDKIKKVQRHTDNGRNPDAIRLMPRIGDSPVLRVEFGARTVDFDLAEADEVTDDPDALSEPGSLLVEAGVDGDLMDGFVNLRLIHEFDISKDPADAVYTFIGEQYANETRQNHTHLVWDPEGEHRYFLFK